MDKFWRWLTFNVWYYRAPPWDTGIAPPELLEFIANHPPGSALDLGCGTGTNAIALAKHGWQVIGVDFARRAISTAKQKARRAGVDVDLRVGDVTNLNNVTGPFDLILDIGCFHSLSVEARQRYAANLRRLLSPDGTFLMYAFFKDPDEAGPGLVASDLSHLEALLSLEHRQAGTERGMRPSAWFSFRPKKIGEERLT